MRWASFGVEHGVSAYIGTGENRWAAVHRTDAARLYRLVIVRGESATVYRAVGDEGVTTREIPGSIARGLGVPVVSKPSEEAPTHPKMNQPLLPGLEPTHVSLLQDLDGGRYFS